MNAQQIYRSEINHPNRNPVCINPEQIAHPAINGGWRIPPIDPEISAKSVLSDRS